MGKGQVVNLRQINGVAKSMINRRHRPDTAATTSQKLAADVLPQLLISQCGTRIKSDSALVQPGHLRWQRCPLFDQHKGTVTDVVQQPGTEVSVQYHVLKYTGGQQRLNPPPAPQRNGAAHTSLHNS